MYLRFGSKSVTTRVDAETLRTETLKYYEGEERTTVVSYQRMVRVNGIKGELAEYLRFQELTKGKKNRAFVIPSGSKSDSDGAYIVEEYWTD